VFDYHARKGRTTRAYLIIIEAPNWLYEFALGGETM